MITWFRSMVGYTANEIAALTIEPYDVDRRTWEVVFYGSPIYRAKTVKACKAFCNRRFHQD